MTTYTSTRTPQQLKELFEKDTTVVRVLQELFPAFSMENYLKDTYNLKRVTTKHGNRKGVVVFGKSAELLLKHGYPVSNNTIKEFPLFIVYEDGGHNGYANEKSFLEAHTILD